MNLSYRAEPRKISLKPYIYPRYYDISESFEKALIQRTKFFNSRLQTSQRQTQIFSRAETFRDIDEFDVDPQKVNKSVKKQSRVSEIVGDGNGDNDEKTIQSLYSRINRLYSLNGQKSRVPVRQLTDRTNNDNEQVSIGRRSSHQSQNSYKRLKQLYQLVPHQYDVQALNDSYNLQETLKSSNQKKRELSETCDIHNCSYTRPEHTIRDQSVQTPNGFGFHSATKRQNSLVVQRNTKQFAVSLFTKLQSIKRKKTKKNSLVSCTNYQYF